VRRLTGKVALVSGAGGGLGAATAERLAAEGAAVVATDLVNADMTAANVEAAGGRCIGVAGDVTSPDDWDLALKRGQDEFGPVSLLVNSAGVHLPVDNLIDTDAADLRRTLNVNLIGPWFGMAAVLPDMVARKEGAIVNITSSAGRQGIANHAAYSASKGGLEALTRQAAVEYAPYGVRINAVAPGAFETPLLKTNSSEANAAIAAATPAATFGDPGELAALVAYLVSPEAGYMVGAIVPLDGGLTAG
jgi:NAD(P)-dependent dehydrogenase (short-subunit alcohol dehydrogenase family)